MKASLVTLTCAALSSLAACRKAELAPKHRQSLAIDRHEEMTYQPKIDSVVLVRHEDKAKDGEDTDSSWCHGNVFPYPDHDFPVGMSPNKAVFDDGTIEELRNILSQIPDWGFDRVWEFKAKVTSNFPETMQFGLPGHHGFLNLSVPPYASGQTVSSREKVQAPAEFVSVVFQGDTSVLQKHEATFSQICLRQPPCSDFSWCLPSEKYKVNASSTGGTLTSCCTPIYCKDTVTCTPSSKWGELPDADPTRLGNSLELCCSPKFCSDIVNDVCTGLRTPKVGSGLLGSTAGECCENSFCRDFTGCPDAALPLELDDGNPRPGASADECCVTYQCDAFDCSKSEEWTAKENASGTTGQSFSECCEPLFCANYTCKETTKYTLNENAPLHGSTDHRCCEPMYCVNHTCSSSTLVLMPAAKNRKGSTDTECCEPAVCINYQCSDDKKYRKLPKYVEANGLQMPRQGFNDTACCTLLYCKEFQCTSTKWKDKEWADDDNTTGWTLDQCCEKRLCENYTCTTDWDGDGNGSKWYKKQDTNALKWQGSTDDECCYPRYCSQYQTNYHSKWSRKLDPPDEPLLGNTEDECYDPVYCSFYNGCNISLGLEKITDAGTVQGSTVDECCENITITEVEEPSEASGVLNFFRPSRVIR